MKYRTPISMFNVFKTSNRKTTQKVTPTPYIQYVYNASIIRGANPGGWGDSSPQRFRPIPPLNICFHPPNKNMFPFPKNRLTYTHVTQH